jgi:hypothetical protein
MCSPRFARKTLWTALMTALTVLGLLAINRYATSEYPFFAAGVVWWAWMGLAVAAYFWVQRRW